ncbi:MAG: putative rane protein [Bacteroidetes bacterium]|nr:putative rane protein [Bacteroidota bacterium]
MINQQIKRGAIISYVAIFVNIAAGLLYTPWMIKQIGQNDYGLYVLMTSVLTYFVVDYGLSQAVTRFLAKYRSEGDEVYISNFLGVTAKLYLALDVLVIVALIIFYFFIDKVFLELTPEEIIKFKQIYGISAFFSIMSFPLLYISGVYYAFELFSQIKLFDLATKLVSVFFTIIALLLGYGLSVLVLVYAATPFVINICKIVYLRDKGYLNINWRFWDSTVLKGILNTSIWLLIILIGELFLKNISPVILGTFSGTNEIAVFSIANTLDSYLLVFAVALNGLFLPKITDLLNQNNSVELIRDLMIKVGRFQVLVIGFLTLMFVLVGMDFIQLWVGVQFTKSYYVLLLLIIPTLLFSILQLGTTYILVLNKLKYQAYIYVFAAISNILLAILLTPKYGAIGSGISILVSKMVFYILGFTLVFHKKLGINMLTFYKMTFRKLVFPLVLIVLLFVVFDHFTCPGINIYTFAINSVVLTVVFIVLMFLFYLNPNEKEMLWGIIRKIKKR